MTKQYGKQAQGETPYDKQYTIFMYETEVHEDDR